METQGSGPTAYDILGVHPTAPLDLVSSSYWNMVKELQARRAEDPRMDMLLHHVMRAYEVVGDPLRRPGYDETIGHKEEPLSKRQFKPVKRGALGIFGRRSKLNIQADPYEVMGLSPNALPVSVHDAYRVMKEQYLRLPPDSRRRLQLLRMLDESYAVLNDPEKRELYDAERERAAATEPEPKKIELPMIEDEEPPVEAAAEEEVVISEVAPAEIETDMAELRATAALEATAATEAATAETKAVREKLEAAQNGTEERKPHGIAAMGASVLRMAHVRGPKAEEEEKPPVPVAPVQRERIEEVRPDVETVLLGRLAASVEELATSVRELATTVQENGESAKPEDPSQDS